MIEAFIIAVVAFLVFIAIMVDRDTPVEVSVKIISWILIIWGVLALDKLIT